MISNRSSFLPVIRTIRDKIPFRIRQPLSKFYKWQYFGMFIIVLVTLILHLVIIGKSTNLVFDENHYVSEARYIIAGQGPIFVEHPPLAKLFIISGIRLFGDNPLGWRFFSLLFGTISIILFYFICRKLDMPDGGPFWASLIFAFENLNFVQSSIAMLDIYMVTFMLLAFLLYLHRMYIGSGLFLALSVLAKLTGLFSAIIIGMDWLLGRTRRVSYIIILAASTILSFGVLFILLNDVVFGKLMNPIDIIKYTINQSSSITFSASFQYTASKPWDWLLQPVANFYTFDPQYIAMISITVWIITIPVLLYLIWLAFHRSRVSIFALSWFAGGYLLWIIIVLVSNRVSFLYYFYPVVGAICIGIGLCISQLLEYWKNNKEKWKGRVALIISFGYVFTHLVIFILLSPIGVPIVRWIPI